MHIHIHTRTHAHIHTRAHIHLHTHTHKNTHSYTHTHTFPHGQKIVMFVNLLGVFERPNLSLRLDKNFEARLF